jgi:molybdate-binding protein
MAQVTRPPIVAGSHDPLLEWALRESGCGLALLAVGSEAGFMRFAAGEASVACMHLHDIENLEADANIDNLTGRGDMHDAVLIGFCRREEGFLVAPGNPLKLKSIADAASKHARVTMRPKGAGAQLLLLGMLHRAKMTLDQLTAVSPVCQTGPDIAQAIRAGRADIGIATRAVANVAGLEFIPIVWEQFDLAVRQSDYFRPAFQTLIKFMASREFAARARELGGYDIASAGTVRHSV